MDADRVFETLGAEAVATIVTQELDAGFGGRIGSPPLQTDAPRELVELVREGARTEVAKRKQVMREVAIMQEKRDRPQRPSLRVLEATAPGPARQLSKASREFLERRQAMIDAAAAVKPGGLTPRGSSRVGRVLEAMDGQRSNAHEAASAASGRPSAWRELLTARGCSEATLRALGGDAA